ncbi:potassium-transporting ATPase subunit KdpC [Paenibacillus daejeonensis]|uniref:potassium-transporting ATPase subunit KdpC n=1 Tax=Paenibacillus daejeonensis TaxID=135193 RepID=UPI0003745DB2|nr:potassium-transporting ATPase subunit KdpC [Paenibacillus daejeonensis]
MRTIYASLRLSLLLMLVCGLFYNMAVTGIAQVIMPERADGSLLQDGEGTIIGSSLIGQLFTDPGYFQSRISSTGYAADASGSTNYAPTHPDLAARVDRSLADWRQANPEVPAGQVPGDLLTQSASGLDPHISPEAAYAQIPRISRLSGIAQDELRALVERHTEGRVLGFLGEPVVWLLPLNLDLDARKEQ